MFFNGKAKAFETPLVEARQLNAAERKAAVFQFDMPLAPLKPGLYTCQVNVIDDATGNFSFPRLPILVREKPVAPPTTTTNGAGKAGQQNLSCPFVIQALAGLPASSICDSFFLHTFCGSA